MRIDSKSKPSASVFSPTPRDRSSGRIGVSIRAAATSTLLTVCIGQELSAATPLLHAATVTASIIQPATIKISGRVKDHAGAPVSGVRITLAELGLQTTTNIDGQYAFAPLPTGRYTLAVRKVGYQSPAVVMVTASGAAYDFSITRSAQQLEPLTVTALGSPSDARNTSRSIGVLSQEALRNDASISLAHSLKTLPGVRSVSTGLQIGKPMIRGLYGARVLTLEDGMRLEDYSWSEEDAPSIDARLAQRVEVIRGPMSVLYGSDALGGVVNVVPEALASTAKGTRVHHTSVEAYGASNNFETGGSARVEGANGAVGWRLSGTGRFGQSIHTPVGEIEHTGFFAVTGQGAIGIRTDKSSTTLRFSQYGGEFKLLEANALPTNGVTLPGGTVQGAAGAEEEGPERKLLDDRVQLVHEQLVRGLRLEAKAQWQRHALVEVSDDCIPPVGQITCAVVATNGKKEQTAFDLLLNTAMLDVLVHHGSASRINGTVGVSLMHQSNDSRGPIFLVPDATITSVGAFAAERVRAGIVSFESSARIDHRSLDATANSQISLNSNDRRSWNAATFNGGVVLQATPMFALVGNVGTGCRAPTLFDLYSNGPHLAEARYEIGDASLKREYDVNAEGGVRVNSARARLEATVFHNAIDNYIYTSPTSAALSGLPVFRHVQTDARFVGAEASAAADVVPAFGVDARYDYVKATNTKTQLPLPLIPPSRVAVGATYHTNSVSWLQHLSLRGEVENVARQTRLDVNDVATGSYTLVNVDFDAEHRFAQHDVRFDLRVQNAGNVAYRDFLSRYKQFALDPGRNISLRISTGW